MINMGFEFTLGVLAALGVAFLAGCAFRLFMYFIINLFKR